MKIASGWNNHCVERAISIMRIALGYNEGLPDNWPYEMGKSPKEIIELLGDAFPNHTVDVYAERADASLAQNVHFHLPSQIWQIKTDNYCQTHLMAFSYGVEGVSKSTHIVVGDPVIEKGMYTNIIIAVEMERTS